MQPDSVLRTHTEAKSSASLSSARQPSSMHHMSKQVVPVQIRAILPYNNGRAIFVGNEHKVFVIYVDESVGAAIGMFMNKTPKERPLTHDLIAHLLSALGAKVDRVIINDLKSETYFARLIISAENHRTRRPSERLHRARRPAGRADLRGGRSVGRSRGSHGHPEEDGRAGRKLTAGREAARFKRSARSGGSLRRARCQRRSRD